MLHVWMLVDMEIIALRHMIIYKFNCLRVYAFSGDGEDYLEY